MKKTVAKPTKFTLPIILFIVLISVFSACRHSPSEQIIYNKKYSEAIDSSTQFLLQKMHIMSIPGISVSVSVNGELVWSQGLGLAQKELNVPAGRYTKYRIGNTTQLFTIALISKLHENGVIDIDENYFKYIPEFKNQNYEISARMLAAHTAGYPYTPEYYLDHLPEVETFRDYITLVEKTNLQFLPDTKHEFSDNNIALLALLAEDVSNTFYIDLLKERILDTLHLKNTVADNSLYIIPNRSGYYSLDYIARLINAPEINLQPFLPMHGLLSTAEDLNTFGCQLLEPGFFNQQTIERFTNQHQLLNGQKINRSQGFLITFDKQNRKIVYFPGNTIGGSSAILIYPDEKLVVSMCANKGDELAALPAYQVSEFFMNQIVTPNKNRVSKAAPDSGE